MRKKSNCAEILVFWYRYNFINFNVGSFSITGIVLLLPVLFYVFGVGVFDDDFSFVFVCSSGFSSNMAQDMMVP